MEDAENAQEVVLRVRAAIASGDWAAARLLLHPYLRFTRADGVIVRGRRHVMGMLERAPGVPALPSSVQLRDGQIYRWFA